ncbi:MAG: hypothetical protein COB67_00575 [SAR324 cluster bacterium]|uniref:Uncharacterized protein n=1 Tax=SAR324 cluster bacterium TaxID=2024889 RepID=A0A2A4TC96_9DELT|nr:MAG: hypothetical protein COB67_00575 [SAR324 cluster bacterium]
MQELKEETINQFHQEVRGTHTSLVNCVQTVENDESLGLSAEKIGNAKLNTCQYLIDKNFSELETQGFLLSIVKKLLDSSNGSVNVFVKALESSVEYKDKVRIQTIQEQKKRHETEKYKKLSPIEKEIEDEKEELFIMKQLASKD